MSREVDSRIVEMQFNNANFEANTKHTMSTIDKLMEKLQFKGAEKGLDVLNDKFSALDVIATTALVNITNKAVNAGEKLVKSLSVDQISSGWSKYAEKTANVQTIMNATGKSIDQVNGYLNKLMWYSDETSFSFAEMTSALSQMTASGGDIEKMIPMIMGIANATADAGKSGFAFQSTIRNLTQSYSAGHLQLQDWKSLNLMGTATKALKQELIDTAVELGKIKDGDVTIATFETSLAKKWADTEVMEQTFNKYASMMQAAYDMVQADSSLTGSDALEQLSGQYGELAERSALAAQQAKSFSEAIDATKDAVSSKWMKTFELIFGNKEEATSTWTELANRLYDVFVPALDTMNETLTGGLDSAWQQMRNAFGDQADHYTSILQNVALASGAITEEMIEKAGGFSEALKENGVSAETLQTALTGAQQVVKSMLAMSDDELAAQNISRSTLQTYADGYEKINEKIASGVISLDAYADGMDRLSGREHLMQAFWNIWDAIAKIIEPIQEAFSEIFSPVNGEQVYSFAEGLDNLTKKLTISDETAEKIKKTFKGVFSVLKLGKDILVKIIEYIGNALGYAKPLVSDFSNLAAVLGDMLVDAAEAIRSSKLLTTALSGLEWIVGKVADGVNGLHNIFSKIANNVTAVISPIKMLHDLMCTFISAISPGLTKLGEIAKTAFGKFASGAAGAFKSINIEKIIQFFSTGVVVGSLAKSSGYIEGIKNAISGITDSAKGIIGSFKGIFDSLGEAIDSWKDSKRAEMMMTVAKAVAVMAASLAVLSLIDPIRLASGIVGVKVIITELTTVLQTLYTLNKLLAESNFSQMAKLTASMISMSAAVLILSSAVKKMSSLGAYEFLQSLSGTVALLVALAVVGSELSSTTEKFMKGATGLIILSSAVYILAGAVKKLGSLSVSELITGLIGVGAVLEELTIFCNYTKSDIGILKGTGLILLASSLLMLQKAVSSFGSMNTDALLQGLNAVGIALLEIAAFDALTSSSEHIVSSSLSMAILCASLNVLAKVLTSLSKLSLSEIGNGLLAIEVALASFAIVLNLTDGTLAGAASMIVMAEAINILVPAITTIGNMSWDQIGKGLMTIADALGIVGLVAALLAPVAPVVIGISLSIAALVASLAALLGVGSAANVINNIGDSIGNLNMQMSMANLKAMAGLIVEFFVGMITSLASVEATLISSVASIIAAVCEAIALAAPAIGKALTAVILTLCDVIQSCAPNIADAFVVVVEETARAVCKLIGDLFGKISPYLEQLWNDFTTWLSDKFKNIDWCSVIAGGVSGAVGGPVVGVAATFVYDIIKRIFTNNDNISVAETSGEQVAEGYANGIGNGETSITTKIAQVAQAAANAWNRFWGIASPSKEAAKSGDFIAQGYANGIEGGTSTIQNAMQTVAKDAHSVFTTFWGIHSPSDLAMSDAENILEGMRLGIADDGKQQEILDETKNLAENIETESVDAMTDAGTAAGNAYVNALKQSMAEGNWITNLANGSYGEWSTAAKGLQNVINSNVLTAEAKQQKTEDFKNTWINENSIANSAVNPRNRTKTDVLNDYRYATTTSEGIVQAGIEKLQNAGSTILDTVKNTLTGSGLDLDTLLNGSGGLNYFSDITDSITDAANKTSSTSKSGSSSSKTLAETISEKYTALLKANKYLQDAADDEWELWELTTGDTATSTEILEKKTDKLTQSITLQAERVAIAEAQYNELRARAGESDDKTKDAYSTMLSEKKNLVELQQNRIESMYEDVLDRYSNDASRAEAEYNLWSDVYEKTATVTEQQNEKIAYMNRKLQIQAEETKIAGDKYKKYVDEFGEESQLAQQAYTSYLEEQAEQQELQNEIQEQQLAYFDNLISLYDKQANVVSKRHSILADIYDDGELSGRADAYEAAVEKYGADSDEARKAQYQGTMSGIMNVTGALQSMGTSLKQLTEYQNKYDEALAQANGNKNADEVLDALADWEDAQATIVSLGETLAEAFDMDDTGKTAMKKLSYTIAKNWKPIQNGMKKVAGKVSSVLPESIKTAFSDTMDLMGKEGAEDTISAFADTVVSMLNGDWGSAIISAMNTVLNLMNTEYGQALIEWAAKLASDYLPEIVDGLGQLVSAGSKVADVASDAASEGEGLSGIFGTLLNLVGSFGGEIGNLLNGLVGEGGLLAGLGEGIAGVVGGLGEGLGGIVSTLGSIISLIDPVVAAIVAGVALVGGIVIANWDDISEFFSGIFDQMAEIGSNIIDGLVEGLTNAWNAVCDFVGNIFSGITDFVCGIFGIHSPSTVFAEIGGYLMAGFTNGISDGSSSALQTMDDITGEAIDCAELAAQHLLDVMNSDGSDEPLIKPLVDLSQVDEGAQWINSMFDGMGETLPLDMAHSASLADSMQATSMAQKLEAARREEANSNAYDNSDVVNAITALGSRMDAVSDSVANLKLVTDTGKLVGEMAPGMNEALGKIYSRHRR